MRDLNGTRSFASFVIFCVCFRTTDEPPIKCPLFEENQWFDCHSEEPWKLGSAQNIIN